MNTVEKIFFLLRERGIEQKQFAIDIGVSQQAVSEWKSGKTQSYRKHIDKIADYFNGPPMAAQNQSEPRTAIITYLTAA